MRTIVLTNGKGSVLSLGVGSPYIIESLNGIDAIAASVQSKKSPTQDGVTYLDSFLPERLISVEGSINIPKNLAMIYAARLSLSSLCSTKIGYGSAVLKLGGSSTASYDLKKIIPTSLVFANKDATDPFQKFLLTLEAMDPYIYEQALRSQAFASGTPVSVTNAGTALTPVTISLIGGTNPRLTNNTTGEYIAFTYSSGGTIIVTTEFGNKTVTISGVNQIGKLDLGSIFFQLAVGSNSLTLTGGGTATVTWYNRLVGV